MAWPVTDTPVPAPPVFIPHIPTPSKNKLTGMSGAEANCTAVKYIETKCFRYQRPCTKARRGGGDPIYLT